MSQPIYSTSVQIPMFSGMNQAGDGYNRNMQYAREMENVDVTGGGFQPMREGVYVTGKLPDIVKPEITTPNHINTLMVLHRQNRLNADVLLVAAGDDGIYTKTLDGDDEWVDRGGQGGSYDWVTYEVNTYPEYSNTKKYIVGERCIHNDGTEEEPAYYAYRCTTKIDTAESFNTDHWTSLGDTVGTIDVLLFSNNLGMYCLYGDEYLDVVPVPTPRNFTVLARYNERIWGVAANITADTDQLVYSAPYDPFDWDQNEEIPEDGAGDILIPTWDGDHFKALKQYGNSLLAIKHHSLWRIYGTDPGNFNISQQYGEGTIEENTVAVYNDQAYMLGDNGLLRYDGSAVSPFMQEETRELMQLVNAEQRSKCYAAIRGNTYCLALPINGSTYCNAILEYNILERTLSLRTQVDIGGFLNVEDRLLYYNDTKVMELNDKGTTLPCKWVSCWQDLGLKNSIKSAFIAYMMVESEAPVELRVGIRTEKKLKQKTFFTKPGKMTRLHLNLQGRIFRLEIQSYSAVPFSISGGIRIDLELDPD